MFWNFLDDVKVIALTLLLIVTLIGVPVFLIYSCERHMEQTVIDTEKDAYDAAMRHGLSPDSALKVAACARHDKYMRPCDEDREPWCRHYRCKSARTSSRHYHISTTRIK